MTEPSSTEKLLFDISNELLSWVQYWTKKSFTYTDDDKIQKNIFVGQIIHILSSFEKYFILGEQMEQVTKSRLIISSLLELLYQVTTYVPLLHEKNRITYSKNDFSLIIDRIDKILISIEEKVNDYLIKKEEEKNEEEEYGKNNNYIGNKDSSNIRKFKTLMEENKSSTSKKYMGRTFDNEMLSLILSTLFENPCPGISFVELQIRKKENDNTIIKDTIKDSTNIGTKVIIQPISSRKENISNLEIESKSNDIERDTISVIEERKKIDEAIVYDIKKEILIKKETSIKRGNNNSSNGSNKKKSSSKSSHSSSKRKQRKKGKKNKKGSSSSSSSSREKSKNASKEKIIIEEKKKNEIICDMVDDDSEPSSSDDEQINMEEAMLRNFLIKQMEEEKEKDYDILKEKEEYKEIKVMDEEKQAIAELERIAEIEKNSEKEKRREEAIKIEAERQKQIAEDRRIQEEKEKKEKEEKEREEKKKVEEMANKKLSEKELKEEKEKAKTKTNALFQFSSSEESNE